MACSIVRIRPRPRGRWWVIIRRKPSDTGWRGRPPPCAILLRKSWLERSVANAAEGLVVALWPRGHDGCGVDGNIGRLDWSPFISSLAGKYFPSSKLFFTLFYYFSAAAFCATVGSKVWRMNIRWHFSLLAAQLQSAKLEEAGQPNIVPVGEIGFVFQGAGSSSQIPDRPYRVSRHWRGILTPASR